MFKAYRAVAIVPLLLGLTAAPVATASASGVLPEYQIHLQNDTRSATVVISSTVVAGQVTDAEIVSSDDDSLDGIALTVVYGWTAFGPDSEHAEGSTTFNIIWEAR
jgi:hypothetical protein